MTRFHWYKRDPDAALSGMAELTLQERGAYNTILDLLYARDGDLPDDDTLLARMVGCHGNEWRAVKAKLIARSKIWNEGGKLTAKRVETELKERRNLSETQRERAIKRWEKLKNTKENNEHEMPLPAVPDMAMPLHPQPHPDKKERKEVEARGTRLAKDWQPSSDDLDFAEKQNLSEAEISLEAEKFRDYWYARAGPGAIKRDWSATWRNWIRARFKYGKPNGQHTETDRDRRKRESREALNKLGAFGEGREHGDIRQEAVQFLPRTGTSSEPGDISGGSS